MKIRPVRPAALGLALALSLPSCGDKAAPSSSSSGEPDARATASASPSGVARAASKRGPIPDQIPDLLGAVPEDATLALSLPSLVPFDAQKQAMTASLPQVLKLAEDATKIPTAAITGLIADFDGLAVFSTGDVARWDQDGPDFTFVLRLKSAASFEAVVASPSFKKVADDRWAFEAGDVKLALRWLPKAKVALLSPKEAALDVALDTLGGARKSFVGKDAAKAFEKDKLSLWADLAAIAKTEAVFAPGSMLAMSVAGTDARLDYKQFGEKVPRLSTVFAPSSHALLGTLPAGTSLALDIGTGRRPGKGLPDLFAEIARASGENFTTKADDSLKPLGISLADLDRAIGDGIALGVYLPDGAVNPLTLGDQTAGVVAIDVKDDAVSKKLFELGKGMARGAKVTGTSLSMDLGAGKSVLVEVTAGRALLGFGSSAAIADLSAKLKSGKTLSTDPGFADYTKTASPSFIRIWTDFDKLAAISGGAGAASALPGKAGSDVVLHDSDKGVDLAVEHGVAAVTVLGTLSALAVYGVRSYLASAKTAEAKNSVGAITRGAIGAYEREQSNGGHALCKSATPVPAAVPSGAKYQPDTAPGKDYETGDETTGWKCLKYTMTTPSYFKYEYRQGGSYKCPARGGTDPGPNGFEVSAEGDLDGDGKTSLFCQTGTIDAATQTVKVGAQLFVVDEKE